MKCRAVLVTDMGHRNKGRRCSEDATKGKSPSLCWTHHKALTNPERLEPLQLVPWSAAEAGASASHAVKVLGSNSR